MAHNNITTPWSKRTIAYTHTHPVFHTIELQIPGLAAPWGTFAPAPPRSSTRGEAEPGWATSICSSFFIFIFASTVCSSFFIVPLFYFFHCQRFSHPCPLPLFLHMERSPALLRFHISKALIQSEILLLRSQDNVPFFCPLRICLICTLWHSGCMTSWSKFPWWWSWLIIMIIMTEMIKLIPCSMWRRPPFPGTVRRQWGIQGSTCAH